VTKRPIGSHSFDGHAAWFGIPLDRLLPNVDKYGILIDHGALG
jgi:hypothetical protein